VGVDVMKGQLCVNQGAFRTSGTGWAYGLEYIAANLDSPCVVLHWPSRRELVRELRRGDFDHVGISFTMQLMPRMVDTVRLVRRHAPRARVILGGYGAMVPEAATHADLVCAGEGISFMRELLGEQVNEPIQHPTIVYGNQLFSLPIRAGRKAMVCTGLGCVNGCDFCASSAKFRRRYVPLVADGDAMFEAIDRIYRETGIDEFQVFDENFLVDEPRARRFADRCEEEGRYFEFFTFSSVAATSRYSSEDLVRMGVSAIWMGFEGKRAGYDKLHGERLKSLCQRLRAFGILVCGSMIIGFDYQTPEIIRHELDEYLDARPTYLQCLMYGPTPGTALYERISREGRWRDGGLGKGVPWGKGDGFTLGFEHPHISADEMRRLQEECYDTDLQHGGPSIYRAIETWLEGWSNLRNSDQDFLRARARMYERKLRACRPLLPVGITHAPNPKVRARLVHLRQTLKAELGPRSLRERAIERLVLPAAVRWTDFKLRHDLRQEPHLIRRTYRC
jgi:haloalkane dehalogenase